LIGSVCCPGALCCVPWEAATTHGKRPASVVLIGAGFLWHDAPDQLPTEHRRDAVKLLYAEDEVLLRLMLADALREAGFQVFEASDGEESISILKTMSVDVVVTDLRMATLTDGLELGRYVRAHCPGVSLVLASAQAPPIIDDVMFDAFFVKPFAPEDLVTWIKRRHSSAPDAADSAVP
jgi:CheY-like chemotaxis protein